MSIKQAKKRVYNQKFTKEETAKSILLEHCEDKIIIEGDKRRVNITVHSGLWDLLDDHVKNKSDTMEKLLIKFLEKIEDKEIVLTKADF